MLLEQSLRNETGKCGSVARMQQAPLFQPDIFPALRRTGNRAASFQPDPLATASRPAFAAFKRAVLPRRTNRAEGIVYLPFSREYA